MKKFSKCPLCKYEGIMWFDNHPYCKFCVEYIDKDKQTKLS